MQSGFQKIMLQQTQVATVIPYYQEFLRSFPTVRHLSKADLSEVLKVWEGLGYYSRARNLHQASQMVVHHFGGKIPDNLKDLLSLPGIGRSTAGAILSFAYNKEAPILDGNIKRVLSRLFAIPGSKAKTEKILWGISESLIPKGHSNPFNQALMDLGSMLCIPKDPQCPRCPLRYLCKAKTSGTPERYPSKVAKKKIPHITAISAVIQKDGRVPLNKRPPNGLLGGLWEFPNWKIEPLDSPAFKAGACSRFTLSRAYYPTLKGGASRGRTGEEKRRLRLRLRNHIKKEMGINVEVKEPIGVFHQTYSHFKLTLHVYHCQALDGKTNGKWVPLKNLPLLPMSRVHRRIADSISDRRL